ncbi:DUF5954 family protein [Actinocorallia longicatena]|uniref:Uncharacterized protein n=1 Tax=Actinocorallia longicatena TaxID=111803 RepID=A0ABP6QPT7_9ACTN
MAFEGMQGYDLINAIKAVDPVLAVREQEAIERMKTYGRIAPVETEFGCAEQVKGHWRILNLGGRCPREARDELALWLTDRAEIEDSPDDRDELLGLARDLELGLDPAVPRPRHEWVAAGRRYRIVRVDGYALLGEDGPEPARHTDTEPIGPISSVAGFWLDPMAPTTLTETAVRLELVNQHPPREAMSDSEWQATIEAILGHPGVILLPVCFTGLERLGDDDWDPLVHGDGPQSTRQALADFLRDELPGLPVPPEFEAAARAIESETRPDFTTDGHAFRIARIIRALRVGPDGPEPPRPHDEI